MKWIVLALLLAACSSAPPPPTTELQALILIQKDLGFIGAMLAVIAIFTAFK